MSEHTREERREIVQRIAERDIELLRRLEPDWTVDPHDSTADTLTVEHAADHLNELLGE